MQALNYYDSSVAERVADFSVGLKLHNIPDPVVRAAENRLIDTLSVGLAGSNTAIGRKVRSALKSGSGTATLWGSLSTATPAVAAFFNAVAAHSEDFDDTHTAGIVHGSACIVPAAWAVAESTDKTLTDVLLAIIVGWELAARIGIASEGAFHRRGFHTSSVAGVFGAGAAAASLFDLDAEQFVNAIGLCGSAAGGLNAYLFDGSQGKLFNLGYAAQAGVQACELAMSGASGPSYVLEGRAGILEAHGDGAQHLDEAFAHLGKEWEILNVSTKPYPVCHFAHATIDAVLKASYELESDEVVQMVHCRLPEPTWDLLCRPWDKKMSPASPYAARFSLPWLVALALQDGDIQRSSFSEPLLNRVDLNEIATRVSVEEWNDSPFPTSFPGSVRLTTSQNRQLYAEVLVNRGHPDAPLSSAALDKKFHSCVNTTIPEDRQEQAKISLRGRSGQIRALTRAFLAGTR